VRPAALGWVQTHVSNALPSAPARDAEDDGAERSDSASSTGSRLSEASGKVWPPHSVVSLCHAVAWNQ
jgi:hypothetical protein